MILHIAQFPMHCMHITWFIFSINFLDSTIRHFFSFPWMQTFFSKRGAAYVQIYLSNFLKKKNFSVISYSTISIRFLSVDAVVSFCELNNLNNFLKLHVEHLITTDLFFQFLEKHSMLPLWMRMLSFANYTIFPSDACEVAVIYLLRLP